MLKQMSFLHLKVIKMEINFAQLICILHTDAKTLSFTPLRHWHLRQNYLNRTFLSALLIFQMSPPSSGISKCRPP